jgi:hypothetical protein
MALLLVCVERLLATPQIFQNICRYRSRTMGMRPKLPMLSSRFIALGWVPGCLLICFMIVSLIKNTDSN